MARLTIQCRRIYDDPSPDDGMRVLVDRLWPRGLRKEDARIDHWAKDLAPSNELRTWFHDTDPPFEKFAERYRAELDELKNELKSLRNSAGNGTLTLLTARRDVAPSHATVLRDVLQVR